MRSRLCATFAALLVLTLAAAPAAFATPEEKQVNLPTGVKLRYVVDGPKVPARVWKAAFRGLLTDDHTRFLADVTAPTLIIWGTQDPIFDADDQTALQAALPGSTFVAYYGAGHNTHWEQPQSPAHPGINPWATLCRPFGT